LELLVGRAGGPQLELLDPVAGKAGVRVAIDEPRYSAETTAVQLLELAVCLPGGRTKLTQRAECRDSPLLAEDVRVLDHPHVRERGTTKRCLSPQRCHELGEITDEQAPPAGAGAVAHSPGCGRIGGSSP